MTKHLLRNISFGLLALITLALAAATIAEKLCGTACACAWFYHSPWMLALWVAVACSAIAYIFRRRTAMSRAVIMLHVSLAVILAGAAVSFATSSRGVIRLHTAAEPVSSFISDSGRKCALPFAVQLDSCSIDYYPGTTSPSDYRSSLRITGGDGEQLHTVSMNNVLSISGYRFYQTGIGGDSSTLTVVHDPWGIAVTYTGYSLFFLSVCMFFFSRRSRFRSLLRKVGAASAMLLVPVLCSGASTPAPRVLQQPLGANFGKLYAHWEGRVVPMQTVARDFCMKLTGKDSYRGFTPEQVLTGWIFYYDDWKNEPMIKVKGDKVKSLLGTSSSRVSLTDFYRGGSYAIAMEPGAAYDRDLAEADERVALISQIVTGHGLKIFPVSTPRSGFGWYSWADVLPPDTDAGYYAEIRSESEALWREIALGRFRSANDIISSIHDTQMEKAGASALPSCTRIRAELLYNKTALPWPRAIIVTVAAIVAMIFARRRWLSVILISLSLAYLSYLLALQWIAGGHIPMSNGYETMQTMGWLALATGLLLSRRLPALCPLAMLVAGLALMVAAMGESNPAVSQLMPVLASPFLSIHVMLVMLAYAIFAMMAVNSVISLFRLHDAQAQQRIADLSSLLLYPAVMALGAGIFVGAIWANQSWGRYWGWDPKETWALVTFFVYALPLHTGSFPALGKPRVLNLYYLGAFLSVLFTYFGVNYLLTGLHSYAG